MTQSNNPSDASPGGTNHDDDPVLGGSVAAQRRRRALREFLQARNMRLADLARSLGLTTANAFYNFTNGHSDALSLPMIERILDVHPDVTFEELTGRPQCSVASQSPRRAPSWVPRLVVVRMEARAGQWRRSVDLPQDRLILLPLPRSARLAGTDAFGVVVAEPGAERAYPAGTLLVARPYDGRGRVAEGARLIVHRRRDRKVEVTIREARYVDGELRLASCGAEVDDQDLVCPSPIPSRRQASIDFVDIAGVVMWALAPEKGVKPG